MDPRRLELLLELSRLGSMREVAEVTGLATSTVSQQLAVLAREAGTALIEPQGRRVRLTPAGQRLAGHAVTVLAALEAARADLDPDSAPAGSVRVAAFATATRGTLLPVARRLADTLGADPRADVQLLIREHEPAESLALLAGDDVDLALTYDYNLAPAMFDASVEARPLWQARWHLGVPADLVVPGTAPEVFTAFADAEWIVNSRNTADEEVVRTVAALAGFMPRITHRVDSLELVQEMVAAGFGVGLLPADQRAVPGVSLCPLTGPEVWLRAYAVTRRGRAEWPPLALVLRLVAETAGS